MSSNHYKQLKKFIKKIDIQNNHRELSITYIGKQILRDIKYKRILRCTCRKLNHSNLDINYQCPNPITTISNMCFHCDKYNDYMGFVNIYPDLNIVQRYETYARKNKCIFIKKQFNMSLYKRYIKDTYLKIKIIDYEEYTNIELFKIPDIDNSDKGILKDKYSNQIGYYSLWKDIQQCIPEEYKNESNCVLHPDSFIPLLEYNLKESSIYHDLTNIVYRQFIFNNSLQRLVVTQNVVEL
tara:strand:+ start:1 stop:717 length:717 start_codon:yes stop_codon:yes gene_type:complete